MSCETQANWRSDLINRYREMKKPKIPKWLKVFFKRKAKYKIACGGSKGVFVFGDKAISIQERESDKRKRKRQKVRIKQIKERLSHIPWKYRKHFNFYDKQFEWEGFVFRRLAACPLGTLDDLLFSGKYDLEQRLLKDLIAALNEAHKVGLIISDLKPDNIMLCKCLCLSFIDLDSAIPLPYTDGRVYSTNWWNILSQAQDYNLVANRIERLFKSSDWIAISLVVMLHYAMRLYDPAKTLENQNNITRRVYNDYNVRDRTYNDIRLLINDLDFRTCCINIDGLGDSLGPAAHAVLRSFEPIWKELPYQDTIDELIRVSIDGKRTRQIKRSLGVYLKL